SALPCPNGYSLSGVFVYNFRPTTETFALCLHDALPLSHQATVCPFCEAEFEEIADEAEAVVAQVVEKGGTVQVVDDEIIGEAKIGALLRY
ncbi:MAG: hypothetical protein K8R89_03900, partial [Anaerolineae bacterium]|nr:hypothetical protein [Anaerolineae bacterium]